MAAPKSRCWPPRLQIACATGSSPAREDLCYLIQIRSSSSTGSKLPVPHGYVLIPVNTLEGAPTIAIKESSISLTLYAQARPTP